MKNLNLTVSLTMIVAALFMSACLNAGSSGSGTSWDAAGGGTTSPLPIPDTSRLTVK